MKIKNWVATKWSVFVSFLSEECAEPYFIMPKWR